jgi:uncharacterized protein
MTHPDDLYADALRSRRRWRWVLLLLALVLVASGTAFALTGPLQASDDDPPADRAAHVPSATTATTASTGDPAPPDACRSPLTPDDPLRLWIGGDSLAGSLGPALGELTGKTGVVQPTFHSRVSSGLGSANFFDWPARAPEDFAKYDPEVTVFIIGANDAKALAENGAVDDRWREQYSSLVEQMLQLLIGDGRTVYWVGAPIMKERDYSARVQDVNAVFQEVVARHPEAHYVDAYTLFADEEGRYATSLPNENDRNTTVREGDGIHLTPAGGDRLAAEVFEQLDPECKIADQAVEGEAKRTVEVRGGSQQPSSRRTGSSPTTATVPSVTTPPTVIQTAPPTTTPPTTLPPTTLPPTTTRAPTPPSRPCVPPACQAGQ